MKIIFFLCSLFFANLSLSAETKPSWINNVQEGCKKSLELCAVGMGTGRDEAQRNAKVELSKIFSTNISSSFTSTLAASSGQTSEDIQEGIKEDTQSVLEGAEISKVYEQSDAFYVLATLNKQRAADSLKLKITDLDNEIKTIYEDSNSASKFKIKTLYVKRQALNQTYLFLTGIEIPSAIPSEAIFKTSKLATKGVVLHINFVEKEPKVLEAYAVKYFSDAGLKVSTGDKVHPQATHILTGKVDHEKQYLNINGFKKSKVNLHVSVANNKNIETGHLNIESITTGRTYDQAYEKALKEILNDLNNKISDLNIE